MKKQLLILSYAFVFILCSCGNSKSHSKENQVNTDSVAVDCNTKSFIVTKDGVGSLKKHEPFVDMSQSEEGLYNKVKKASYYDEPSAMTFDSYTLYLNDVEVATFLQETPTSSILNLRITSPYVSLSNGIKIGMLVKDVLDKEGVTASASFDEMGETELGALISINFEGIELTDSYWDKEGLTANGMKKIHSLTIDNSSVNLDKSDFKHESKIPCFIP